MSVGQTAHSLVLARDWAEMATAADAMGLCKPVADSRCTLLQLPQSTPRGSAHEVHRRPTQAVQTGRLTLPQSGS